jgi:hypothetical protein
MVRAIVSHVRVERFLRDWFRRRTAIEFLVRTLKRSIFAPVHRVQIHLVPFQNSAAL